MVRRHHAIWSTAQLLVMVPSGLLETLASKQYIWITILCYPSRWKDEGQKRNASLRFKWVYEKLHTSLWCFWCECLSLLLQKLSCNWQHWQLWSRICDERNWDVATCLLSCSFYCVKHPIHVKGPSTKRVWFKLLTGGGKLELLGRIWRRHDTSEGGKEEEIHVAFLAS